MLSLEKFLYIIDPDGRCFLEKPYDVSGSNVSLLETFIAASFRYCRDDVHILIFNY